MNARSRILVGASIIALGAATLWVAALQAERDVRYVEDIVASPREHAAGAFTLMGVPEPERIPFSGPNGTFLAPNPDARGATRTTFTWTWNGTQVFTTHTLRAEPDAAGDLVWTFRNETRRLPTDPDLAVPAVEASWRLGRAGEAFTVVAFTQDARVHADTPRLWAYYPKAPENPMQPKPSQFVGRALTHLPDGTPLPDGAALFLVEEFTAGCSSKFLPPAYSEQQ
jgi:hypothetical protein